MEGEEEENMPRGKGRWRVREEDEGWNGKTARKERKAGKRIQRMRNGKGK